MRQWRSTDGQASSEYVALVALVASVLALAAGLTSGGVGGHVLAGLQRGLCQVADVRCPTPKRLRDELDPCPVERTTRSESLGGTFEVLALGRSGTLTAQRTSDGRVTVTLADGGNAGAQVGVGLKLKLGRGHGAEATAGLGATVEGGRSWTLPNAAAARAFLDRYGAKATIGGKAVDLVRSRCSLLCDAIGWHPHAELPPPDEEWIGHGAAAQTEASLGPATVRAEGEGLLGVRRRRDGERTWFMRVGAAAGAELVGGVGVGVDGERQAVVSYTRDAGGRPLQLVVHTARQGGVGAALRVVRRGGRVGANEGDGVLTELDATLDLRDAGNRAAADAFVSALRNPLARSVLVARAATLRAQIAVAGIVDRRVYTVSSSAFDLGATIALGAQLGASFERTREGVRLLSAETRLPGLPFLPRDDCRAS
jgi:hypothetical protein